MKEERMMTMMGLCIFIESEKVKTKRYLKKITTAVRICDILFYLFQLKY